LTCSGSSIVSRICACAISNSFTRFDGHDGHDISSVVHLDLHTMGRDKVSAEALWAKATANGYEQGAHESEDCV